MVEVRIVFGIEPSVQASRRDGVGRLGHAFERTERGSAHDESEYSCCQRDEDDARKKCRLDGPQRRRDVVEWERFEVLRTERGDRDANTFIRLAIEGEPLTTARSGKCLFDERRWQVGLREAQRLLGVEAIDAGIGRIEVEDCITTTLTANVRHHVCDVGTVSSDHRAHQLGIVECLALGDDGSLSEEVGTSARVGDEAERECRDQRRQSKEGDHATAKSETEARWSARHAFSMAGK